MASKNRLELTIMGYCRSDYYESSHYDDFGAYWVEDLKYLSYGKKLKDAQKIAIIENNLNSWDYDWNEDAFHNMLNIYHFRHVRKNSEHVALSALSASVGFGYSYWERWSVLKDGTILKPKETEKIISLLLAQAIEIHIPYSYDTEETW